MNTQISASIMQRELAYLVTNALNSFSYYNAKHSDIANRIEVVIVPDGSWQRSRTRTFQVIFDKRFWKSFSLSEEDLGQALDFVSQNYLAPTAFEVIIPAIPPEILYYLAA